MLEKAEQHFANANAALDDRVGKFGFPPVAAGELVELLVKQDLQQHNSRGATTKPNKKARNTRGCYRRHLAGHDGGEKAPPKEEKGYNNTPNVDNTVRRGVSHPPGGGFFLS